MAAWDILHILAWGFGLYAVYGLRDEFDPRTKTWAYLLWGVWSCLIMEAAMFGSALLPGLALLSALTGISSGLLIFSAFQSLQEELCHGKPALFGEGYSQEGSDRARAAASNTFPSI